MRQPIIFQQYYVLLLLAFAAVWSSGCEKDSIVHENLIIDNNTPPENNNVSTLQLNNYLNNIYIDLYGRAPTEGELAADRDFLRDNGITEEARGVLIEQMMESYE